MPADPGADVGRDFLCELEDILTPPGDPKLDREGHPSGDSVRLRAGGNDEAHQAEGVEVVDRLLEGLGVQVQGVADLPGGLRFAIAQKFKNGESSLVSQEASQGVLLELHARFASFSTPEGSGSIRTDGEGVYPYWLPRSVAQSPRGR
jgi:hypothetical protein